MHAHMYACMYVCMYVRVCTCTYVHTYVNMYAHWYACMYVFVPVYTVVCACVVCLLMCAFAIVCPYSRACDCLRHVCGCGVMIGARFFDCVLEYVILVLFMRLGVHARKCGLVCCGAYSERALTVCVCD